MTIEQVKNAAKAAEMTCTYVNVTGAPGVQALDLRDPGAKAIASSVQGVQRLYRDGQNGSPTEKGLEVMVLFSASSQKRMEVKARSFGDDSVDSNGHTAFYNTVLQKFGNLTAIETISMAYGISPVNQYFGPRDGIHAMFYHDDSPGWIAGPDANSYNGFDAVMVMDPGMVKQSEAVSHPTSAPPKL